MHKPKTSLFSLHSLVRQEPGVGSQEVLEQVEDWGVDKGAGSVLLKEALAMGSIILSVLGTHFHQNPLSQTAKHPLTSEGNQRGAPLWPPGYLCCCPLSADRSAKVPVAGVGRSEFAKCQVSGSYSRGI